VEFSDKRANEAGEIELAIIHSFVNNDKWRLFYVYIGGPIGRRVEREKRNVFWKAKSEKEWKKRNGAREAFRSPLSPSPSRFLACFAPRMANRARWI
jgi:hypothetical protein